MNTTTVESQYVGWYPSPQTRGTSNILITCISTLVLCVYTALHLNVPWCHQSFWAKIGHQTKWIIIGVLMPEVTLSAAVSQYVVARYFQTELAQHYRGGDFETEDECKEWQIKFSYLAMMGGYQLVSQSEPPPAEPSQRQGKSQQQKMALRLTPECIVDLLKEKADFEPMGIGELEDRSNASALAKVLSSLQACSLAVELVVKIAQGMPVTELEVNTLAHVLCAVVCWWLWLKKPYNVGNARQITLSSPLGRYLTTRLLLHHEDVLLICRTLAGKDSQVGEEDVEPDHERLSEDDDDVGSDSRQTLLGKSKVASYQKPPIMDTSGQPALINNNSALFTRFRSLAAEVVVLEGYQTLKTLQPYRSRPSVKFLILLRHMDRPQYQTMTQAFRALYGSELPLLMVICEGLETINPLPISLDESSRQPGGYRAGLEPLPIMVNPWTFALQQAFWTQPKLTAALGEIEDMLAAGGSWPRFHPFTCLSAENPMIVPISVPNQEFSWLRAYTAEIVLFFLPLLYGAMHIALWNAHFPTQLESTGWRVAAIIVCAIQPCLLVAVAFATCVALCSCCYDECCSDGRATPFSVMVKGMEWLGWGFLYVNGAVFVFARTLLVVESFLALRSQPIGVYQQIVWTQLIPHL